MSNRIESPLNQKNLAELSTSVEVLAIKELTFQGHVNLRGATENATFMAAAQKVLGVSLPTASNTFVVAGDNTVLWLGPNEWLIVTPQDQQVSLVESLRESLADTFAAVTDITGGNTILEISGSATRDLLAKASPLDFHHSVFAVGQCAQTVLAHAGMTVYLIDDAPIFRLIIRRSFADYIGTWMLDAAREFA